MGGILWLSSYPKSGNTWLRAYLANLFQNPAKPVSINDLPKFALGDNFLIHYAQFSGKKAEELTPEDIVAMRPRIHEWFAQSQGDTVFVKTHNACVLADGQPLITPSATAGAIYVIRNPFDVAVSFAHHLQVPIQNSVDILCAEQHVLPPPAGQIEQPLLSWSGHVRSWTTAPGMRLHVVRYEDMEAAPLKAFRAVSKFLGLPDDKSRIRKAIRFSSYDELKAQEDRGGFVEARPDGKAEFFRTGKSGAWRESLTEAQAAQLIEAHREILREHRYLDKNDKLCV